MELDELEQMVHDTIIAGIDIDQDEEEDEHHGSFARGIRKVNR